MTEKQLQQTVLAYLKVANVFHWRASAGQRGRKGTAGYAYPAGTPDILACVCGRFVGIELKSQKGKMRPAQEAWREACERAGGRYLLIRELDELRSALRAIGFAAP